MVEVLQYMQQEATTLGDLLGHPRDPAGQAAVLASFLAAALRGESSHHLHADAVCALPLESMLVHNACSYCTSGAQQHVVGVVQSG